MQQQQVFGGLENLVKLDTKAKLESRFIVPPFSVLDTRQGYWQDRKRLWISLGITSEVGRSKDLTFRMPLKLDENERLDYRKNTEESESKQDFYAKIVDERGGGTSIFDPVLCELCYKWFCPQAGTILDPFAGGSVRGITAHILGYTYYGIDLSSEQIEANNEQASIIVPANKPNWIVGNSLDIYNLLPSGMQFDFIFSCPPYYDLEQYSDNKMDLSNMRWNDFKDDYSDIIYKSVQCLKPNRFACFVVGEIRDNKGFYRGFVPFTIAAFTAKAGMRFYNDIILMNPVGSLPIRINNMFGSYRKIGKVHQNVLVFFNGKADNIPQDFNNIETELSYL